MIYSFLFLLKTVTSIYAAIDFGSQYTKISVSSIKEPVSMALNHQNKALTPSAIAFNIQNYSNQHMTLDEAHKCEVKIGESALHLLKKKSYLGTSYLARIVGRQYSNDYEIPDILNTTEMLAIFFRKMLSGSQFNSLEAVAITIPNYYTLSQRECIIDALNISGIQLFSLLDDASSIIQLYTIQNSKKFVYESHAVLFIDIGASCLRAYRVVFTQNETDPLGTQTSYEWTEKIGGFHFIRKVALYENCSFSKAQKLLIRGNTDYSHLFEEDLETIYDIIQEAINGEVDEIQLIGGGSRFPFIVHYIKSVVGYVDVLKDLPSMDSIALGSLHIVLSTLNQSKFKLIPVIKPPYYSSYVECGGIREDYCTLHDDCKSYIVMPNAFCKTASIISKSDVPEGASKVLAQYDMVNLSDFPHEIEEPVSALFVMQKPAPFIASALWCKVGDRFCQNIKVLPTINEDPTKMRKIKFVTTILQSEEERVKRCEYKSKISMLFECLSNFNKKRALESYDSNLEIILEQIEKILDDENDIDISTLKQNLILLENFTKSYKICLD